MKQTLYMECYSGISGDMTVAALLDLGADEQVLRKTLRSLPVDGFEIAIKRVKKAGLDVCDFDVILDKEHENHDHDMKYLHGQDEPHVHAEGKEAHDHEEAQEAERHAEHHAHDSHHEHRNLQDILAIIEAADMTEGARRTASRIFEILAAAEAKAHGTDIGHVHFHEVGAVDSIADIVAVAVCLDNLNIENVVIPVLYEGCGTVRCQHGVLPIPVPAVANIVAEHHLPMHMTGLKGEFVTPTGAAIAAAIQTSDKLPEKYVIHGIGIGAGKREYGTPGILRVMLIEEEQEKDTIWKLESNIDDCTGERLAYTMEFLLKAGAKDVYYTPVYMKKNRPAYQLNVLCTEADREELETIIFAETTTIGIRRVQMERTVLERRIETVQTSLGEAQVKVCSLGNGERIYPEYESVALLCNMHGLPFGEVFSQIEKEAHDAIL